MPRIPRRPSPRPGALTVPRRASRREPSRCSRGTNRTPTRRTPRSGRRSRAGTLLLLGRRGRGGGLRRLGLGLGLVGLRTVGRRRARAAVAVLLRRCRTAVGRVEAGALEDDPHWVEHLAERSAADPAGRQRILDDSLKDLDVLTARGAFVLVGGHREKCSRARTHAWPGMSAGMLRGP